MHKHKTTLSKQDNSVQLQRLSEETLSISQGRKRSDSPDPEALEYATYYQEEISLI